MAANPLELALRLTCDFQGIGEGSLRPTTGHESHGCPIAVSSPGFGPSKRIYMRVYALIDIRSCRLKRIHSKLASFRLPKDQSQLARSVSCPKRGVEGIREEEPHVNPSTKPLTYPYAPPSCDFYSRIIVRLY